MTQIEIAVNWFMSLPVSKRIELSDKHYPEYKEDNLDLEDEEILEVYKANVTTIKETQIEALKAKIYGLLMANAEMDMGDMNDCKDAANELVSEWIDENNITITD